MPRRHLWIMLHDYGRYQLAGLHAFHLRHGNTGDDLPARQYEGHQGPRSRPDPRLRAVRGDPAMASLQDARAREGATTICRGARPDRWLLRMYPLLLLHLRLPKPLVEWRSFSRASGTSSGVALADR